MKTRFAVAAFHSTSIEDGGAASFALPGLLSKLQNMLGCKYLHSVREQ